MEGVRETDKDINDCQINRGPRSEMPREHSQGKDGHAIRRKSDGVVAKPSAAIGNVAVRIIYLETVNLPEEEYRKKKMRELVAEFHQPADIGLDTRNDKQEEERDESQ